MGNRELTPMRRAAREEARVWPVALVLVGLYLLAAHNAGQPPEAMTTAPTKPGDYSMSEPEAMP
jgi:hypothetical protein